MWWTRREQSFRTIAYQISNSVAGIIGPLMAWGIGRATTDSGGSIMPYQGIFLCVKGLGADKALQYLTTTALY
jgi:hypothetical protein